MSSLQRECPAEAFFLNADSGQRFCLYHAPHPDGEYRGSFIYVHPFAEEMNRSRRMAALQARTFADAGFGVLQIDLFGCGDSSGQFGDARWPIWKEDLTIAMNWLEDRTSAHVGLWGLRLGALLALDFAMQSTRRLDALVLWQPVISGEVFLTQFLRMRLAGEMLARRHGRKEGTEEMRHALAAGESIEVAGYELSRALAASIDSMDAGNFAVADTPVFWFEVVADAGRTMPPAAAGVASAWKRSGVDLHLHEVPGTPFWASQEITECRALLSATTQLLLETVS